MLMTSPGELAAALRGLGYSSAQAARLAEDPQGEVSRIAAMPFRAPARPKPVRLPHAKRRRETADNGRRIFHGYREDLLVRTGGRWSASRKAGTIEAVRAGSLSVDELQAQHGITAEEWATWVADYDRGGRRALKVCSLKPRRRDGAVPARRISLSRSSFAEADHDRR